MQFIPTAYTNKVDVNLKWKDSSHFHVLVTSVANLQTWDLHAKYNKEILSLNLTLVIIQTRPVKKNRTKSTTMKGKWTNEALEEAMEVVERGMHSLKGLNKAWNIPVTALSHHLVG